MPVFAHAIGGATAAAEAAIIALTGDHKDVLLMSQISTP
jgi:hypothetical protein